MREYLVRFTAEQQCADATPSVRRHEDQVAATTGCRFDDRLVGDVAGECQFGTSDPGFLAQAIDKIENLLGLFFGEFGEFLGGHRVNQGTFTVIGHRVFGFGVKRRNLRTDFLGKLNRASGCFLRELRTISWNKDVFEHDAPFCVLVCSL